jgi:hypothetical protein
MRARVGRVVCLLMLRLCHKEPQLLPKPLHLPFFPPTRPMVISQSLYTRRPRMQRRRDATAVMAGLFDPLPERDILTSCLNHIGPYYVVEKTEEERQRKKTEKRQKDRDRKRKQREEARAADKHLQELPAAYASSSSHTAGSSFLIQQPSASSSSKHVTRPTIHIPAMQRSFSITPSPPSSPLFQSCSPDSTPGPSVSSSTSRTSSKRPRTPDDYEGLTLRPPSPSQRLRKKRIAVKKGWKGWVEGSPEPSAKLINLDAVPVLRERRTRSGKNFDAIGVGKDSWI